VISLSNVYRLKITAEDPIFFSTQEANKRINTGRYIHNYALTYSLLHASGQADKLTDYSQRIEKNDVDGPRYFDDLADLNFYIFPAKPADVSFTSEKVNTQSEGYKEEISGERGKRYFTGHTIRRISIGSTFETFLISESDIEIPEYARLGKFMSKVQVEKEEINHFRKEVEEEKIGPVLNALDTPEGFESGAKNLKVEKMRPSPVILSAIISGKVYQTDEGVLPANVGYLQKKAD
jgi:CRISPR-associated protein Csc1